MPKSIAYLFKEALPWTSGSLDEAEVMVTAGGVAVMMVVIAVMMRLVMKSVFEDKFKHILQNGQSVFYTKNGNEWLQGRINRDVSFWGNYLCYKIIKAAGNLNEEVPIDNVKDAQSNHVMLKKNGAIKVLKLLIGDTTASLGVSEEERNEIQCQFLLPYLTEDDCWNNGVL